MNYHAPRLNPNVPSFIPNAIIQETMARLDEEILALKLMNFEKQIELNQKNEEIQRLKDVIVKLVDEKESN